MKNLFILAAVAAASTSCAQTNITDKADIETGATNTTTTATMPEPATPAPVIVVIDTSLGVIRAELNAEKAPITVANFLSYVDEGFFNKTIFHRVIPNFMIQGGGFTADMSQKPTKAQIKNEATNGLKNERGTLAMARTGIVNSATSQFFINHKDNASLDFRAPNQQDYGYCVFGKVIEGLDVVDKIATVETGNKMGHGDVPLETVTIISITREK